MKIVLKRSSSGLLGHQIDEGIIKSEVKNVLSHIEDFYIKSIRISNIDSNLGYSEEYEEALMASGQFNKKTDFSGTGRSMFSGSTSFFEPKDVTVHVKFGLHTSIGKKRSNKELKQEIEDAISCNSDLKLVKISGLNKDEVKLLAIKKEQKNEEISYSIHPLFFNFVAKNDDYLKELLIGKIVEVKLVFNPHPKYPNKLIYAEKIESTSQDKPDNNSINLYNYFAMCINNNPELKQKCCDGITKKMAIKKNAKGEYLLSVIDKLKVVKLPAIFVIKQEDNVILYGVEPLFFKFVASNNNCLNDLLKGNIVEAELICNENPADDTKLIFTEKIAFTKQQSNPNGNFTSPYKYLAMCLNEAPNLKQACLDGRVKDMLIHKDAKGGYKISPGFAQEELTNSSEQEETSKPTLKPGK